MTTREQYLNSLNSCEDTHAAHRAYYAQFVSAATVAFVAERIGASRILSSTDKHMNDIPLRLWDRLAAPGHYPVAVPLASLGEFQTLGTGVCILKEAAQQFKEKIT